LYSVIIIVIISINVGVASIFYTAMKLEFHEKLEDLEKAI
jgi:hypothetical protein